MAINQTLNFDNASNFLLDGIEIDVDHARLEIIPNPGVSFSQTFTSSAGFTYDSSKAEFVAGLLQQKDQTASGSRLAAKYDSSMNANWNKDGVVTATLNGTPTLVGGKLSCINTQGVTYPTTTKPAGAVKFKYTPNYNVPSTNRNIIGMLEASGVNNRLGLFHSPSGNTLRINLNDASGTIIHTSAVIGAAWTPTIGQEYEIELNWDSAAGIVRLFINGVVWGTLTTAAYTRASGLPSILSVGANTLVYNTANASYDDVILFNSVQHTSGYTPGYTPVDFIYAGSKVDGPNFTYSGIGTVQSIDSGSVTEAGSPRYIVGLRYWNGSSWVISNGTYAQANDSATALANLGSFDASGGILPWSVVFTDTNTQSNVDYFEVVVTGEKYSPLGTVEPLQGIQVKDLVSLTQVYSETLNSLIQIQIYIDGVLKYFDGASWVNSDGSFLQSNTYADVQANIGSISFSVNSEVFFRWIAQTSSNTETATITTADIVYNFGSLEVVPPTCVVYGYYKDISGNPVEGATVSFVLVEPNGSYNEADNNIIEKSVSVVTDENGYFDVDLIYSSSYEGSGTYKISISKESDNLSTTKDSNGDPLTFLVPDAATQDITALLTA